MRNFDDTGQGRRRLEGGRDKRKFIKLIEKPKSGISNILN
jgi:hypothetical protein